MASKRSCRLRRKPGAWWKSPSGEDIICPLFEDKKSGTVSEVLSNRTTGEGNHQSALQSEILENHVPYRENMNADYDFEDSDAEVLSIHQTAKMKRNRGRGNNSLALDRINVKTLLTRSELVQSARSRSTQANIKRAKSMLQIFAAKWRAPDPKEVTPRSSLLIMNLVAKYCKFDKPDSLKNDAMGSLIQGLRIVYEENEHTTTWSVQGDRSSGNPLIGNPDITKLRQAHRVNLSKHGIVSVRARPLTVGIVCDHAAKYWFQGNDEDILLHAIFVVDLNLGLRFDEVGKLMIQYVSVTSDFITLRTELGVKNQTSQRSYRIEDWPGKTALCGSVFMDPKVALLSWLSVRGASDGYLFCDVSQNSNGICKVNPAVALSSARFNMLMRKRLLSIGIGKGDVLMYSGHSLKRGSVQLHRSLGLRDEYVMKRVQMVGPKAYANYCEAYNDCAPEDLPRFASENDYLEHATRLMEEKRLLLNHEEYSKFMTDVAGLDVHLT